MNFSPNLHPIILYPVAVLLIQLVPISHVALSVLVFLLLKHPVALRKLQEEIDTTLTDSKFASYATTSTSMPYLDACIKECFRMHPPAGFIMERVTPASGAVVCGRQIPGGVVIGCSPWAVHRHKPTFGDDVDLFRPERWIEASEEEKKKMEKALCHFGSGSHHCIGKGMSLIEVYKMGAELFRRYEV
jgi:cytochrome P450